MCGEVTAWQTLDLEPDVAQPFLCEVDLPVFKGILLAAAYKERELTSVRLEEAAEVEPVALRRMIGHEARCCGEVEQAIVTVHGAVELADLGVRDSIAFGPHHPCQPLEEREGTPQTAAGPVGEAAQDRCRVPWVGVPVRTRRVTWFNELRRKNQRLPI